MLLVRYYLESFDRQNTEVKVDLYCALRDGYFDGSLRYIQIQALVFAAYGYTSIEIAGKLNKDVSYIEILLNAGLEYLASKTGYTDESVIYSKKKEVKPEWVAKTRKLAMEWNNAS